MAKGKLLDFAESTLVPFRSLLPITKVLSGIGHILMFHRVVPREKLSAGGMWTWQITPETLEKVIQFYQVAGFDFLGMDAVCDRLASSEKSKPFVSLTFDDGYQSVATRALPILKKYQVPATIYVVTNYLHRKRQKWDDELDHYISLHRELNFQEKRYQWGVNGQERAFLEIAERMMELNTPDGIREIEAFFSESKAKVANSLLTVEELRQLSEEPLIEIGSHSCNHYVLKALTSDQARQEIESSKQLIEDLIQKPVSHFAYPYGTLDQAGEREYEMAKTAGYRCSVTTLEGNLVTSLQEKLQELPRYNVDEGWTPRRSKAISSGLRPTLRSWQRRA